jgi:hypothetical protein
MKKHESVIVAARGLPLDSSLPRPVVLRPEDLAAVAAAGVALAASGLPLGPNVIRAGGIRVQPEMF